MRACKFRRVDLRGNSPAVSCSTAGTSLGGQSSSEDGASSCAGSEEQKIAEIPPQSKFACMKNTKTKNGAAAASSTELTQYQTTTLNQRERSKSRKKRAPSKAKTSSDVIEQALAYKR